MYFSEFNVLSICVNFVYDSYMDKLNQSHSSMQIRINKRMID